MLLTTSAALPRFTSTLGAPAPSGSTTRARTSRRPRPAEDISIDHKHTLRCVTAPVLVPADEAWKALRIRLDELLVSREAEQRKHLITKAALQGRVKELEDRIMSYTDMPVTRADYELLTRTANTLKLAWRTWKAMHVDPQTQNAADQQRYIEELAARVHAQLRIPPAKTSNDLPAAEEHREAILHD
ncbi:hypothetical protein [Pseudomonas donghuensis]|uniref:hypothetical protein n=1 Tax=Pseudomonas donghuensis TaxID=1163398 RepID=UPI0020C3D8CE|nr:hypothetical protein [Pseudomonas donghuensis]MCP6698292.1 hypothetical protein [Pseudomonas donghuensis]